MTPIVPIGGRGDVIIYMHHGYDKPLLTIGEYVDRAERINVGRRFTLIDGSPEQPLFSWPVYARRHQG